VETAASMKTAETKTNNFFIFFLNGLLDDVFTDGCDPLRGSPCHEDIGNHHF
jgi:hypothetical protein